MNNFLLRIDDIGASTKHFNQYGKKWFKIFGKKAIYFPFANFGFLKRIWPFKGWAKYDELTAEEWKDFLDIFAEENVVPIVAITASWVEADSTLTPFPKKFPAVAQILKEAFQSGQIIIANHGLTHCVVGKHLPRFWRSNREFHREFLPTLPQELHREHLLMSQEILESFFEKPIEILVPPGNVWSRKTYLSLVGTSIKKIMCNSYMADSNDEIFDVVFINDKNNAIVFHDRELKLYGLDWLKKTVKKAKNE